MLKYACRHMFPSMISWQLAYHGLSTQSSGIPVPDSAQHSTSADITNLLIANINDRRFNIQRHKLREIGNASTLVAYDTNSSYKQAYVIKWAVGCHYFPPDLRLPSQPQNITTTRGDHHATPAAASNNLQGIHTQHNVVIKGYSMRSGKRRQTPNHGTTRVCATKPVTEMLSGVDVTDSWSRVPTHTYSPASAAVKSLSVSTELSSVSRIRQSSSEPSCSSSFIHASLMSPWLSDWHASTAVCPSVNDLLSFTTHAVTISSSTQPLHCGVYCRKTLSRWSHLVQVLGL